MRGPDKLRGRRPAEGCIPLPCSSGVEADDPPCFAETEHPSVGAELPPRHSLPPDSQSVPAHVHHQLQGRVPVFGGLTAGAALIIHDVSCNPALPLSVRVTTHFEPHRPGAEQAPTNRLWAGTVPRPGAPAGSEAPPHKGSGRELASAAPQMRFSVL